MLRLKGHAAGWGRIRTGCTYPKGQALPLAPPSPSTMRANVSRSPLMATRAGAGDEQLTLTLSSHHLVDCHANPRGWQDDVIPFSSMGN